MKAETRSTRSAPARTTARATRAVRARKRAPAAPDKGTTISAEERRAMIEQAAYFRAEKRGFAPGEALQDWLAAEAEIDGQFASQTLLEHQLGDSDT